MNINKKNIIRISIITIVLFTCVLIFNVSHASVFSDAKAYLIEGAILGVGTILVWGIQLFVLVVGLTMQAIMTGLSALAPGEGHVGFTSGIMDIIFNKVPITTASFFSSSGNPLGLKGANFWSADSPITAIIDSVSEFYIIVRNLSIAMLLFVLLYIAIRMAMSTVASEEARYKKMLKNWAVSLAVVFVLHIIMIATFYVNNVLVEILYDIAKVGEQTETMQVARETIAKQAIVPLAGFGEAIVYTMTVGIELTFFVMYIKRTITLAFLIVIAPLITVTYSIDKIGDGRSQALNTWLKEFMFTVLVQPFHCLIYIVLIQNVIKIMATKEGVGVWIIYVIMLSFWKEAEQLIKKIFNIQTDSMPGAASMGALALGLLTTVGGLGKSKSGGSGSGSSKKKMPDMKGEQGKISADGNELELSSRDYRNTLSRKQKKAFDSVMANKNNAQYASREEKLKEAKIAAELAKQNENEGIISTVKQKSAEKLQNIEDSHPTASKVVRGALSPITAYGKAQKATLKMVGGDEGVKGVIKNVAKAGVATGVAAMGLGMADGKAAIGAGLTAYAAAGKIEGAIKDYKDGIQLEENEDTFTENYERIIKEYMDKNNVTADIANNYFKDMVDKIESGTIKDSDITPEVKNFVKIYDPMHDSYDVANEDKPDDNVKKLMDKAQRNKFIK